MINLEQGSPHVSWILRVAKVHTELSDKLGREVVCSRLSCMLNFIN